ncbi:MAG TPA: glycosyltransferase 87 family protein [bacterium]|nr:glycosyltransferase 87 family protein [bacterium]
MRKPDRILIIVAILIHASFLVSLALHFKVVSVWPPRVKPEVTIQALDSNLVPVAAVGRPPGEPMSISEMRRERGVHLWDRLFYDSTKYEVGFDFFGLYKGALDLLRGRSIYQEARYDQNETVFSDEAVPYYCPYIYPPLVSYFMVPLAIALTPFRAFVVWTLIQELLLVWCIMLSRGLFTSDWHKSIVTAMWLCFGPYYLLLYIGQTSFVIAACLMLLGWSYIAGRPRAGDWAWIISVALKLLTLIAAPILLRFKRYRAVIIAIAIVIAASAPYFAFHPQDVEFFAYLVKSRTVAPYGGDLSHSEVSYYLFGPELGQGVSKVFMWAVIMFSLALTFLPKKVRFVDGLSLWMCTYFLAYIRVWEHHYVMIVPILVLLFYSTRSNFVLVMFVLLALPTPFFPYSGYCCKAQNLAHHLFKLVPVAMLYVFVAKTIIARRKEVEGGGGVSPSSGHPTEVGC